MAASHAEDDRPPTAGVALVGALAALSSVSCAWLLWERRRQLKAVRCRLFPQQLLYIVTAGLIMHINVLAMVTLELLDQNHSMVCGWEWLSCCGMANLGFHAARNALILAETHLAGSFLLQACGCHRATLRTKLLPVAAGVGLILAVLPVRSFINGIGFCPEDLHFDVATFCLLCFCISVGLTSLVASALKAIHDGLASLRNLESIEERFKGRWRRALCYVLIFLVTFGPTLAGFVQPWLRAGILTESRYIVLEYSFQSLSGMLNASAYMLQKRRANRLLWELLQKESSSFGGAAWPAQALAERAASKRGFCPGLTFDQDEEDATAGDGRRPSELAAQGSLHDAEARQSAAADKKKRKQRRITRFLVDSEGTDGVDIVEIADVFDEASMRADMELELLDYSRNPEIQRDLHASVSKTAMSKS